MALATFECSAATCGEGLHDGQLRDHPVIIESSGAVLLQRDSPPITELCVHVPVNIVQEKTWNYKPNPLPPAPNTCNYMKSCHHGLSYYKQF